MKVARCRLHQDDEVPASWSSSSTGSTIMTKSTALQSGLGVSSPSGNTNDGSSSFSSGGRQHFDFLKAGELERLNILFARAIHRTAQYPVTLPSATQHGSHSSEPCVGATLFHLVLRSVVSLCKMSTLKPWMKFSSHLVSIHWYASLLLTAQPTCRGSK